MQKELDHGRRDTFQPISLLYTNGNTMRVMTAQAPGSADLGSFGEAEYMLIRQFNFPDTYDESEKCTGADHDRLRSWDNTAFRATLQKYVGTGEGAIGDWARRAKDATLLAFCVAIVKADPAVAWTGCRVLGTVNRSNGFPVFTIEVFAKGVGSLTPTYSGASAPNVEPHVLMHEQDPWWNPALPSITRSR